LTVKGRSPKQKTMYSRRSISSRPWVWNCRFEALTGDCPIAYMHLNGKYGVILNLDTKGINNREAVKGIGKDLARHCQ
jgi:hypothetical protein